jgi:hypothetical protein
MQHATSRYDHFHLLWPHVQFFSATRMLVLGLRGSSSSSSFCDRLCDRNHSPRYSASECWSQGSLNNVTVKPETTTSWIHSTLPRTTHSDSSRCHFQVVKDFAFKHDQDAVWKTSWSTSNNFAITADSSMSQTGKQFDTSRPRGIADWKISNVTFNW